MVYGLRVYRSWLPGFSGFRVWGFTERSVGHGVKVKLSRSITSAMALCIGILGSGPSLRACGLAGNFEEDVVSFAPGQPC